MDLGEREQSRKENQPHEDNVEKDDEANTSKTSNIRKSRKNASSPRGKKSRSNSGQNRRESTRSRSRSRTRKTPISSSKKSWKSANAWLNFMQDFRENLRGFRGMRNASVFRLAGEQWSEMTPAEKKPYVDAANKVKRMKQLEIDKNEGNEKRSKKRPVNKKNDDASKVSSQKKNKNDEDNKSDSEYDSAEEGSTKNFESDNASMDTDGSI